MNCKGILVSECAINIFRACVPGIGVQIKFLTKFEKNLEALKREIMVP